MSDPFHLCCFPSLNLHRQKVKENTCLSNATVIFKNRSRSLTETAMNVELNRDCYYAKFKRLLDLH